MATAGDRSASPAPAFTRIIGERTMRIRTLLWAAALPAALFLVGCGPTTSGTGGTKTEVSKPDGTKTTLDESFKITGMGPYSLKQGESKSFEFKVEKGKDMKSDVDIAVEGADKLKVEAVPAKVPASGDGKFAIKITAPDDTAVAEHTIKMTGKSDKGSPVDATFKVKVDKK
jgi:hypothetical protein